MPLKIDTKREGPKNQSPTGTKNNHHNTQRSTRHVQAHSHFQHCKTLPTKKVETRMEMVVTLEPVLVGNRAITLTRTKGNKMKLF